MSAGEADAGAVRAGLTAATLPEAFARTVAAVPDRIALRTPEGAESLTWREYDEAVERTARGLYRYGVRPGDRVALLLGNRPAFHIVDAAVMRLGGVAFSVYSTYSAPQVQVLLDDAGARLLVTEGAFAALAGAVVLRDAAGAGLVAVDGDVPGADALADVVAAAAGDPAPAWPATSPHSLLTLIYTSGTTGPPKGVELTQGNAMAAARSFAEAIDFPADTAVISYLPMAHVAERNASHYLPMTMGFTTTCCASPADVYDLLPAVQPSWFFGVPRIWEKVQARIEAALTALPEAERAARRTAIDRGVVAVELIAAAGTTVGPIDRPAGDEGIVAAIRREHGLDRLCAAHTGAAPMPPHTAAFFHAIGIPLGELWGLSETTGAGTASPAGAVKFGTVGCASPGMELALAADGEVLLRGPLVMRDYRNRPVETAEAIDPEGWFHTGDLGVVDPDGYLSIVGRKKEIIISSSGKNMSPSLIEAELKAASGLLAHVCVIGDARPYNVALLVPDPEALAALRAAGEGSPEQVQTTLGAAVERANARLARVEQIKRFLILDEPWTPEAGQLTPTMKLKRGPIAARYAAEIDALYAQPR